MQEAIAAFKTKKYQSLKKAAAAFDVSRTTLIALKVASRVVKV